MKVVPPMNNWIPYRLEHIEQDWLVHWLYLGDKRMDDSFFDDTIRYCRSMQKRVSRFGSCSSTALLMANEITALKPQAFVFHVSRCGSTLLSQAFAQSEACISIAEAPLLDEILRSTEQDPNINKAQREEWFKAALSWMGQKRTGQESTYIVKLDSWHIHFYALLREWFPETPFFFLTRCPGEILASHAKIRGIHMIPSMINPFLLKLGKLPEFRGDFNTHGSNVLKHYYLELRTILMLDCKFNRFFDYSEGAKEMLESFSQFTGIELEPKMYERLKFHSKSIGATFNPEPKEADLSTNACREAYQEFINATQLLWD
jgi:gluconate kinase